MVAAGENSGSLPAIADRLADMLERQAQVRGKISQHPNAAIARKTKSRRPQMI
jgi:hypothetical protein